MRFLIVVLVASCLALGGCKILQPDYAYDAYTVAPLKIDNRGAAAKLRKSIELTNENPNGLVETQCFKVPVDDSNEDRCRQQRNAAISALAAASSDLCETHIKSIFGNEAAWNIGTGSIALLLSSFATVANVATAKTALSAGSTFANAERSLVNETAYKSVAIIPVVTKIHEMRELKGKELFANSHASINEFPMNTALLAVIDYHYSCSFMRGLEKALNEGRQSGAAVRKAELEQERRALQAVVDQRTVLIKAQGKSEDNDSALKAVQQRMDEIDKQLLILLKNGAPIELAKDAGKPQPADPKDAPKDPKDTPKDPKASAKPSEPLKATQ